MSHTEQINFVKTLASKEEYIMYFNKSYVLDVGSLDINGNNKCFFENCIYLGVDLDVGDNVDIPFPVHQLNIPDQIFDTVISTEMLEHDKHYKSSIRRMIQLLKPGGLLILTCATTGRPEHGTINTTINDAPFLVNQDNDWGMYYKNLTENDLKSVLDPDANFKEHKFIIEQNHKDLYFFGVKKGCLIKDENQYLNFIYKNSQQINQALNKITKNLKCDNHQRQILEDEKKMLEDEKNVLIKNLRDIKNSKAWKLVVFIRKILNLLRFRTG